MPALCEIFDKRKIRLYQNESLDLDHYYQEPYQKEDDEIKEMSKPFKTNESKKIHSLSIIWYSLRIQDDGKRMWLKDICRILTVAGASHK